MLRLTHSCIIAGRRTAFMHPTIRDEDLGAGWAEKYLDEFLSKLDSCMSHLRNAIFENDEQAAVQHYKRALGSTFPS